MGKNEVQLSSHADDMLLYLKHPKISTKKLLEIITQFSKMAGYKVNTHKFLALLYIKHEPEEKELKEAILFTIEHKKIKYLGINLRKEVGNLFNHKTF